VYYIISARDFGTSDAGIIVPRRFESYLLRRPAVRPRMAAVIPPGDIALIFDMDNTVLGSHIDFAAIRRALGAMLREAGVTEDSDDTLRRRGIGELIACGAAHDRGHGTALLPAMWAIVTAHEAEGLRGAAALDGASAVLATLRARGYRLAILTNNSRTAALRALESAGLAGAADTVVTRDDVAAMKPAADGAIETLRRLGPARLAYVIGDSWIDGTAAAGAGARFIAYRRTADELRPHGLCPWRVINHLAELLDLDLAEERSAP
jgi:phosphoglycolate phosphatase